LPGASTTCQDNGLLSLFNSRACATLILLAGAFAYVNTFDGDFVWDDASSVLLHKHVQDPSKVAQLFREDQHAFGAGQGNFYRPLVSLSFMVDFFFSYDPATDAPTDSRPYPDISPLLFHLTNLAWHIAAALFLFLLLGRLGAPLGVRAAAVLLFVVHPLHTEAVAYISGRADMMSAAFLFAGLACLARRKQSGQTLFATVSGMACFVAALLSKESSTIFPLLLALVVVLPLTKGDGSETPKSPAWRFAPLAVAFALLAAYAGLRLTVLRFAEPAGTVAAPVSVQFIETGQAFARYIQMLFVPVGLHMEQTLAGTPMILALLGYLLLVTVVAVVFLAAYTRHWRIVAGFSWFLIAWAPISGMFPLNAPLAEHWMYVPMAGFWWGIAELGALLAARAPVLRTLAPAVITAGVLLFLALTVARNEAWRSNTEIYRNTLAANPHTYRIHANLAETYKTEARNLAGARRHYEATLDLYDRFRTRAGNQGILLQNETYFQWSRAMLLLGDARFEAGINRSFACSGAADACAEIRVAADLGDEDSRTARIVAMMGQAYAWLALGDFERAAFFYRNAFLATGDLAKAREAVAANTAGASAQSRLAQESVLLGTANLNEARGRFLSAAGCDPPFAHLAAALEPETLFWPNKPEAVWRSALAGAPAAP